MWLPRLVPHLSLSWVGKGHVAEVDLRVVDFVVKGTNMSQTLNPNPNPNLVRAYRQGSGDLIRRAFPERNLARTRACAAHTRRNGKIGAPLARGHT